MDTSGLVHLEGVGGRWILFMHLSHSQPNLNPVDLLTAVLLVCLFVFPPVAMVPEAYMASCSLLRFLWCMLWCLTSSSLRANLFWQLGQRQLKGFSPDSGETDGRAKEGGGGDGRTDARLPTMEGLGWRKGAGWMEGKKEGKAASERDSGPERGS